jgi:hypothetical protein
VPPWKAIASLSQGAPRRWARQQKPKADKALTLVTFMTFDQRLVDHIAVPLDTNEEAAVAAHLPHMDLAGSLNGLVSRICGLIPAPEAGLTCDKGLFP